MGQALGNQRREETLHEVTRLLDSGDTDTIVITAVRKILAIQEEFVGPLSDSVQFTDFSVPLVLRCIARKSQEALCAIVEMVERGQAYQAMALLRPMCEELIFARFIRTLPGDHADEYVQNKAMLEILQGVEAQRSFFQKARQRFPSRSWSNAESKLGGGEHLGTRIAEHKRKLRDLGRRLGWGKKPYPDVLHMARSAGSVDEYEFFYHAASSAVHASLHHLARMVWGNPNTGRFSITNKNFETYYRRFVLIYGVWLCSEVMEEIRAEFPDKWPEDHEESYSMWLTLVIVPAIEQQFPPIVTEQELRWKN